MAPNVAQAHTPARLGFIGASWGQPCGPVNKRGSPTTFQLQQGANGQIGTTISRPGICYARAFRRKRSRALRRIENDWAYIPGFDRDKEQYVKPNLSDWAERNGIKEEGERQGQANQPPQHADRLDETEAKILAWVNTRADTCRNDVTNHLGDLERELATTDIDPNLEPRAMNIRSQSRQAGLAIDEVVDRHGDQLARQTAAVLRASADFDDFRRHAKLGNRLPDDHQRKNALVVIAACFAVEVILNAGLLMEVNAFGLVGAALQMALISAINVLVGGWTMGGLLRQAHHVSLFRKALAWLGIGALVPVAVLFNLAIGHFRDSMEAVLTDPDADVLRLGTDALERFAANPVGLDSFQSALLALVGFLFFCVASWKWLHRDDTYPQYGKRHRQLENVLDQYSQWRARVGKELKETYTRHQSAFDDEYHQLTMICPKAFEVRARAQKIVDDYTLHLGQYDHHLDFLLATYRTANRKARTEPAPPHFETVEQIDRDVLTPPSFSPPPESDLTRVFQSVDDASSELQGKYAQAMAKFPTLDALQNDRNPAPPSNPSHTSREPVGIAQP